MKRKKIKYDCLKCTGYCCSYDRIEVSEKDIKRLAKYFGMAEQDVKSRHTKTYKLKENDEITLDQPGTGLSGGQQQRLCIARAIAVNPEVILMDEPCSALDPIATAKIEELISELRSEYTIVIVTHSMQQAARVSDRTAYFHLGKLVEVGKTKELFINPVHELTQDYITGRFG